MAVFLKMTVFAISGDSDDLATREDNRTEQSRAEQSRAEQKGREWKGREVKHLWNIR